MFSKLEFLPYLAVVPLVSIDLQDEIRFCNFSVSILSVTTRSSSNGPSLTFLQLLVCEVNYRGSEVVIKTFDCEVDLKFFLFF